MGLGPVVGRGQTDTVRTAPVHGGMARLSWPGTCLLPVVGRRQADTGKVDERKIDVLSDGDRQPPRAVGATTTAVRRDAA